MVAGLPPPISYCRMCGMPRGECRGGTGCGFYDDPDPMEQKYYGIRIYRNPPSSIFGNRSFGSGRRTPRFASHPLGDPFPELAMIPEARPQAVPRARPHPPVDFVGGGEMHRRWR